jgi:hypothetical protein
MQDLTNCTYLFKTYDTYAFVANWGLSVFKIESTVYTTVL